MNHEVKERPNIPMTKVESSQLESIGHHPQTNTLAIRFNPKPGSDQPGGLYHYDNFTAEDFDLFNKSESKGSHFYKHIKNAKEKHPYTRIE
jgi:hypothetical protein